MASILIFHPNSQGTAQRASLILLTDEEFQMYACEFVKFVPKFLRIGFESGVIQKYVGRRCVFVV